MTVNNELHKIGECFNANRLSLNIKKRNYTFFHKNSVKDNIPLQLLELKIADRAKREQIQLLLDENITWKNYTCSVEKKLAKNIDLLYRAKYLLDELSLKTVYFLIFTHI